MIKVLVNGAKGRMGSEAVKAVSAENDLQLVGETDIGDDLAQALRSLRPDVVIDFTIPEAGIKNTRTIIENGVHPVIGTSGFREADVAALKRFAEEKKVGGLIAPNFSIGAVLMMKFSQDAAKYLPHVEIIELHHDGKADSPSGTAVRTAEMIAEVRTRPQEKPDRQILPGARGAALAGVHIHAVRLPGLVAHQRVMFGGKGESLTIQHDSLNRESFMPGVILACRRVPGLNELVYGLEHIL